MSDILCIYYSRTGNTEDVMRRIGGELDAEMVRLEDGVDRSGLRGWLRSGMQAMSRRLPAVAEPRTARPLGEYALAIVGTPVWAGRCSAPVRSFLREYGQRLPPVAYVITRGSDGRYEEVFDQMDLYVKAPRVAAVTIRPGSVGSDFWQNEFLKAVREAEKGGLPHVEGGEAP